MNRFDKHEKGDKIKWAIIFTVVAALIVGFFAIVTKGFTQNDPKTWFSGERAEAATVRSGGAVEVTSGAKLASSGTNFSDILLGLPISTYMQDGQQYVNFPEVPSPVYDDICILSSEENRRWVIDGYRLYVLKNNRSYKVSHGYLSDHNWKNISVEDLLYNGMEYKNSATFSAGEYEFKYSVTFAFEEGATFLHKDLDISLTGKVTYSGDGVPLPETPSKTGYTFAGWYYDAEFTRPYDNQKITADTQLYAKFDAINYGITYNIQNWGDVNGKLSYTIADETYALPIPTRTGYNFMGWYDNANFTGEAITEIPKGSTGEKSFYAKFEICVYKVSFYVDGELYLEMDVEYGTRLVDLYLVDISTMTAVAFSLDSDMLTLYDANAAITNNMSLFTSNEFVIYAGLTYNIDGVETMDLLDYNSTLSNLRTPTKDGYTFDGWYYDAEYTQAVQSTDKLTSNKTIFAKFTEIPTVSSFWNKVGAFFHRWWWAFVAGGVAVAIIITVSVIETHKKKG